MARRKTTEQGQYRRDHGAVAKKTRIADTTRGAPTRRGRRPKRKKSVRDLRHGGTSQEGRPGKRRELISRGLDGWGGVMNGSEWRLGAREACVPLRKRLPHSRPRQHCIAAPRRAKRRRRSRPRPEVARTRGSPAPTRFWSAPPKTQPDRDVRRPQARPGRARRRARRTRRRVRFHHRMCGGRARSETPPRWVSPRARW